MPHINKGLGSKYVVSTVLQDVLLEQLKRQHRQFIETDIVAQLKTQDNTETGSQGQYLSYKKVEAEEKKPNR